MPLRRTILLGAAGAGVLLALSACGPNSSAESPPPLPPTYPTQDPRVPATGYVPGTSASKGQQLVDLDRAYQSGTMSRSTYESERQKILDSNR